jgi:hypothetical protein
MKYSVGIVFMILSLVGCSPAENKGNVEELDLEMAVINDILPLLIPDNSPCMIIPIEGESNDQFDERLQAFYDEVDSVGKKLEIVNVLTKLDSSYIEAYKRMENSEIIPHLLNAPDYDRKIDLTEIEKVEDIRIVVVKEPRTTVGGFNDCYTLGQFTISRVGFNDDSTRAAFIYFIDDGSCIGGEGGIVNAKLNKGKWRIVE